MTIIEQAIANGTKEITVYAHNLMTGEEIPVVVGVYGWQREAKHAAAHYWSVCWDMVQVNLSPA
jgi:hypothetical protein